MHDLLRIAGLVLREISSLVINQFFWLVFILLVFMYKKSANVESVMLGKKFPLVEKASHSLVLGVVGGLVGSFLVITLGITLQDFANTDQGILTSGIMYIWVIAVLLSLINTRYLCFSYAGGIIALSNLLTGFPVINVPGLLALIGVLHLIESILIRLDGYTYSVPLFLKKKDGSIVGGYMMNKMWPIPLVLLAFGFLLIQGGKAIGIDSMPGWWPILNHSFTANEALGYMPFLVPVILGYGDIAITRTPEQRCRESAARLAVYSIILIFLSIAASKYLIFAFAAALFAPLAHEAIILHGKKEEETGRPIFGPAEKGVTILYSKKNSPSEAMKLEPGDIILSVNNKPVEDEKELADFLAERPTYVWFEVKKISGAIKTMEYQDYGNGVSGLGALVVPKNVSVYFELNDSVKPYEKLMSYIKKISG